MNLLRLIQDDDGVLYTFDGRLITEFTAKGKLKTIRVQNPASLDSIVKDIEKYCSSIPKYANAVLVSDFNPDTQFVKDEKAFSCYAIQFYGAFGFDYSKKRPK